MTISHDALHLRDARPAERATIAELTKRAYAEYSAVM